MKRMRWRALLLAAALAAALTGGCGTALAAESDGTRFLAEIEAPAGSYVEIATAEELDQIRDDLDGHYVLTQDIDLTDWGEWDPIGSTTSAPFTGTLDGQGHVIRGLDAARVNLIGSRMCAGLFGYARDAVIKNLGLEDMRVEMNNLYPGWVGGLVGSMELTGAGPAGEYGACIDNCYTEGVLTAKFAVRGSMGSDMPGAGGLAGRIVGSGAGEQAGLVRNSYNRAVVTVTARVPAAAGGIVGVAEAEGTAASIGILNCYNGGAIQVSGSAYSNHESLGGGLLGTARNCTAVIRDSYNSGPVTVRGLLEENEYSYEPTALAGGLVGRGEGAALQIQDCYSTGDVSAAEPADMGEQGDSAYAYAGGLVGYSGDSCSIIRGYTSGSVTASAVTQALTAGVLGAGEGSADIRGVFVLTDRISGGVSAALCPRLMGSINKENVLILDTASTVLSDATGTVTAAEAAREETYAAAGWAFGGSGAWKLEAGRDYPALSWEFDMPGLRPVLIGRPVIRNLDMPVEGIAPNVGNTLYADISALTTDMGREQLGSVSYQWLRNGRPISGANGSTLRLDTDNGVSYKNQEISVRVTAEGCVGWADSEDTLPVEDRLLLVGTPVINITSPEIGDKLSVDLSGVYATKGSVDSLSLTYEWRYGSPAWGVSTSESYMVSGDELGHGIYVRVSASGAENYVDSAYTDPVKATDFPGGSGTEEDPYQIGSVKDWTLFTFRMRQEHIRYVSACYELTADLDFTDVPASATMLAATFSGTMDGNGHVIRNLEARSGATSEGNGLFRQVVDGGVVKNLHLENVNIAARQVGGIVGLLQDSTLSNCTFSGELTSGSMNHYDPDRGGLVWRAENSVITDCRSYAQLPKQLGDEYEGYTGGVVAVADNSRLERVYNFADVDGGGGIAARLTGNATVSQAFNYGKISGAGIVAQVTLADDGGVFTFDGCVNYGRVTSGGIVGSIISGSAVLTNCVNCGAVNGGTGGRIGGLIGQIDIINDVTIQNCANTGSLSFGQLRGSGYAGNVVGYINDSADIRVDNFYGTAYPTAGGSNDNKHFGRLFGEYEGRSNPVTASFSNCFIQESSGYVSGNSAEYGCYKELFYMEMQTAEFAETLNGAIAGDETMLQWSVDPAFNDGYPILAGQRDRILYADRYGVEIQWETKWLQSVTDFVLAVYDRGGRLLAVQTTSTSSGYPERLLFREPLELTPGCVVKVFCLNQEDKAPLHPAMSYTIQ